MKTINKYWWILGVQGLFLTGIGVMALFNTALSLKNLVEYLGLILLGFGFILALLGGRSRKKGNKWAVTFFTGVFQVGLGLFILFNPSGSSDIFKIIIGGWALLMATIQLIIGIFSKTNLIVFFINSIVSAAFGALIIWFNFDDIKSLTALVGIYTAILGITVIYYAIKLKVWSGQQIRAAEESALETEKMESNLENEV
tara:strand:+ start:77 stop:673 length:597 start_codon:yes stop_codon:yes gene_type:complete